MLVVVVAVGRVQVLPVPVVDVAAMHPRLVSALAAVDVHVAAVRDVRCLGCEGPVIDVVPVGVVEVPVVEEVEVVLVGHARVPAPRVVSVWMAGMGDVRLMRRDGLPVHDV